MTQDSKKSSIALTFLDSVGNITIKKLLQYFSTPEKILSASKDEFLKVSGIHRQTAEKIVSSREKAKKIAEKEYENCLKNNISPLVYGTKEYPKALEQVEDAPYILYTKGKCDYNTSKMVSIVGTRKVTEYGIRFIEKLIGYLKHYNCVIVSGLAYGVDIFSHNEALKNNLETIAVLGSGFSHIYPQKHTSIAKKITEQGAVMTEFPHETSPNAVNFPKRNRIIAGISDCTIVIESGTKGGSIITAVLANEYNKDVFALCGDYDRPMSKGCLELIKTNKAFCLSKPEDISLYMNWEKTSGEDGKNEEKVLLEGLSEKNKEIYAFIRRRKKVHFDEIAQYLKEDVTSLTFALFELEGKNLVRSEVGNYYRII